MTNPILQAPEWSWSSLFHFSFQGALILVLIFFIILRIIIGFTRR